MAVAIVRRRAHPAAQHGINWQTLFPDGWADVCLYGSILFALTVPLYADWARAHILFLAPLLFIPTILFLRMLFATPGRPRGIAHRR